ncbi:MAG: iron-sulfur cluster repair di-iron protein [Myxococcales bacterium]|nr:iron-sulfur cluster repair di-iron protein [Myxococcales bacterium]
MIDATTSAPPPRWDTQPLPEIIHFVLSRYHEPHREELPALIDAARRVEREHADKPSCPRGLAAQLAELDAELRQHMAKEEQVLFPAILSGRGGPMVHMPIRVMMQEHEDHGASLQRLRDLTGGYVPPPEACSTWLALYAGLGKLEAELLAHIRLENEVLFRRALNG